MNLPNKLTILRICLVPVFIACFYIPIAANNIIAAVIFILAYITDILDGYIARKNNIVSDFGKLMDPMADKMLTCSALIMLCSFGMLSPLYAIVVIVREFIITGIRLVSAGNGVVIAANWLGKLKTITQCITVVLVLLHDAIIIPLGFALDVVFIWISLVFTVWSAVDYIVKNYNNIKSV